MPPIRLPQAPSDRLLRFGALLATLSACALAKGGDSGASANEECVIASNPIKFGDYVLDVQEGRTHLHVELVVLEDECVIPASDWSFSCPSVDESMSSQMDGFRLQPEKDITFEVYLTEQLAAGTPFECALSYQGAFADSLTLEAP